MKPVGYSLALACLVLTGVSIATADDIPILTVCEVLGNLKTYAGKSIIVVGRSASTDEGSWLTEDCGLKVMVGEREFSASISATYVPSRNAAPPQLPKGFVVDQGTLQQKLAQLKRTTRLRTYKDHQYDDKWIAMFGRLEARLPPQADYAAGYGHLNGSPAQLVWPMNGVLLLENK